MEPSHVKKFKEIEIEDMALKQLSRSYPKGFELPIDIEYVAETHKYIDSVVLIPEIENRFGVAACLYCPYQDQIFDIVVDEDTYLRQRYRANFSIAHEFGHIVLHYDLFKDCCEIEDTIRLNERIKESYKVIEDDANRFAGAIMMPYTNIKLDASKVYEYLVREYGFNEQLIPDKIKTTLAQRYDVSFTAMKIRLKELSIKKKISTALYREYHMLDDL